MSRRVAVVVVGVLAVLLPGGPAVADPAGPTHFRSVVDELVGEEGDPAAVDVDVLGGDAFLAVRAAPGVEVQVPGYDDEPYLRIAPDGTVQVNDRSPARWLNDARFGEAEVEVPASADPEAPPAWRTVGDDGVYAWHDHRIHFMSPALPPAVDPDLDEVQPVLDWEVPMLVDGRSLDVHGSLSWVPGPSTAVPIGTVLLAVAAGLALISWKVAVLPVLLVLGGVVSAAVGLVSTRGLPPGAEAEPALVVLPATTLGVVAVWAVWSRRDAGRAGWLLLAGGALLGVWAFVRSGALVRPIVPGGLPIEVVRVAVAVALAAAVAAVGVLVQWLLAATTLDATPEETDPPAAHGR